MFCQCGKEYSNKCIYKLCGGCCKNAECNKHISRKTRYYANDKILTITHDIIYDLILDFPNDIISIIIDYFDNYIKCITCDKLFENSINDIKCKVCIEGLNPYYKRFSRYWGLNYDYYGYECSG
jgi:hypothetical protein